MVEKALIKKREVLLILGTTLLCALVFTLAVRFRRPPNLDDKWRLQIRQELAQGRNWANKSLIFFVQDRYAHNCLAISPNNRLLATGAGWGWHKVAVWDIKSKTLLFTLKGQRDQSYNLVFSPDNSLLASGCRDKTVHIWNVKTRKIRQVLLPYKRFERIEFSPDNRFLLNKKGNTIEYWNIETGEFSHAIGRPFWKTEAKVVDLTSDYKQFVADYNKEKVHVRQLFTPDRRVRYDLLTGGWYWGPYAFSTDQKNLVTVSESRLDAPDLIRTNVINLWDLRARRLIHSVPLSNKIATPQRFAFSPDGTLLAFGYGYIKVWNLNTK